MSNERGLVLVLTGVSGAGKTTVGKQLAQRFGFEFHEGDEYHSAANKAKMHAGVPLDDDDRWPWLQQLRTVIDSALGRETSAVLTCSALKHAYRERLRREGVRFVYLRLSRDLARERLRKRTGHFFDPQLLESQFETLEEPHEAIVVDASERPERIVEEIARACRLIEV